MIYIRHDDELDWLDWGTRTDRDLPRYKTFFSAEETATQGLLQGTLSYPPGASVVPHWHTPVETYFVLAGEGRAHLGEESFRLRPGSAVYVPSRAIHWFENDTDSPLKVFWTLACDAMTDIDFTPA